MSELTLEELAGEIKAARDVERQAAESRRFLEERLLGMLHLAPDGEGTLTRDAGAWRIKVTQRLTRKVDADVLQTVAAEIGLDWSLLARLVKWDATLQMRAWKAADPAITGALSAAITTTPGRPSVSIEEL